MAIRLNKALKELNVGINTAAEFLQKKGVPLEDASPNAKLTDNQYDLLVKEFGTDKTKHAEVKADIQKRKEKEEKEKQERKEQQRQEKERERKEKEEKEKEKEKKQQFKIVGNINDLKPQPATPEKKEKEKKKKKEETAPQVAEPSAETSEPQDRTTTAQPQPSEAAKPQNDQPSEPQDTQTETPQSAETAEPQTEEKKEKKRKQKPLSPADRLEMDENGVYRLAAPQEASVQFKQVGFIDLNSINTKTRPDRKSASERKKERNEKRQQQQAQQGQAAKAGDAKKKRNRIGKERIDVEAAGKQVSAQQPKSNKNKGQQQGPGSNQQKQQQKQNAQQQPQGKKKKNKKNKPVNVQELSDEEVAKQVKETLARLTSKQEKKGVKYRKEKRDAIRDRMAEEEMQESAESKVLKLTEFVTVSELATMMDVPVNKVIGTCMSIGMMVSINQRLDAETINIVAEEFGFTTNYVSEEVSNAIEEEVDAAEDLLPRAPIITVMGHVDHGKTSLLDYIRKTNVIAGEAGGITQHIGAYNVKMKDGRRITFLDTPGHEAFTAMRARGAQVTDIAIIIIAADDAIMPQTKEAIAHAQAAGVPMVFAINKIDKPGANPEKIKEQLAGMNLLVEDWGGKYQSQEISAKKGIGVEELMDKVLLEAEILDLKANPNRKATGSIIESTLDKGRGYVATVLCQNGTLHVGDIVLAGTHYGKIKAMFNERGQRIEKALPAEPAVILGLNGAPTAGDTFHVMETEHEAREICNKREQLKREQGLRTMKRVDLNELGRRIALGDFKELNLVVKGDVDGSIEALSDSLIKLSTEKIQVNVIYKAVGQISESDVTLASASDAIIIGFQVRPSAAARKLADQEGVDIRLYSIIYDTIEEIKDAMEGMLAPTMKEEVTGQAEVRQVYKITKVGTVAGCWVTEGKIHRTDKIRVIRDGIVVHTGEILALKRFKDDVKEIGRDFECGISIVNYNDIQEGDIFETYTEVEVKAKL